MISIHVIRKYYARVVGRLGFEVPSIVVAQRKSGRRIGSS